MEKKIFNELRNIVYEHSGINLNKTKEAMVASRIAKRMRILGITAHGDYLKYLLSDTSGDEISKFLDVISTNVTSFFREHEHFEYLAEKVTDWVRAGQKKIRIWSAASSTGEEPYTIVMTVLDAAANDSIDFKILATDISTRVLAQAQSGEYLDDHMEKVPDHLKKKYFAKKKIADGCVYTASQTLKRCILFRRLNLSQTPFPMKGNLDAVFCRNVMIYFNNSTRGKLVGEIYRLLKPGGLLFTGHAESLTSLETQFKCLRPSIYQK